ncbi:hypothetical protein V1523DRAFT_119031 [Lipomyces doorenjongii]
MFNLLFLAQVVANILLIEFILMFVFFLLNLLMALSTLLLLLMTQLQSALFTWFVANQKSETNFVRSLPMQNGIQDGISVNSKGTTVVNTVVYMILVSL